MPNGFNYDFAYKAIIEKALIRIVIAIVYEKNIAFIDCIKDATIAITLNFT